MEVVGVGRSAALEQIFARILIFVVRSETRKAPSAHVNIIALRTGGPTGSTMRGLALA